VASSAEGCWKERRLLPVCYAGTQPKGQTVFTREMDARGHSASGSQCSARGTAHIQKLRLIRKAEGIRGDKLHRGQRTVRTHSPSSRKFTRSVLEGLEARAKDTLNMICCRLVPTQYERKKTLNSEIQGAVRNKTSQIV